jgi:hypothetical protein
MNRYGPLLCVGLCLLVLLTSCEPRREEPGEGVELASATEPGGAVRAFAWLPALGGIGATVSQPYQVWMQSPHGEPHNKMIFEADHTDGVRLSWKGPRALEICYGPAQINRFVNYYYVAPDEHTGAADKVEVRLRRVDRLADC